MTDSSMTPDVTPPADWKPQDEMIISTLETLRVFSDALRQQILMALMESPRTVKQIAAELGRVPTKLYYHVKLLEDHGLIRVTDTRIVSGIIEKRYRAAACNYAIDRALITPSASALSPAPNEEPPLMLALDAVLAPLREEVSAAVTHGLIDLGSNAAPARRLRLARGYARLSPEDAAHFFERLEALLSEFEAVDAGEDETGYRLILGLFPAQPPRHDAGPA